MKAARLWVLPGATLLLALMAGCGAAGLAHHGAAAKALDQSSVAQPTPPATACAGNSDAILPASTFGGHMVITTSFGEPQPIYPSVIMPGQKLPPTPFLWLEDRNYAVPGLPSNFSALSPSPLATQDPSMIFQAVETVNSFKTVADAIGWANGFLQTGPAPAAWISGKNVLVPAAAVAVSNMGDFTFASVQAIPGSSLPVKVFFVIRRGATVLTLSLTGGSQVTVASALPIAREAVGNLTSSCPGLG